MPRVRDSARMLPENRVFDRMPRVSPRNQEEITGRTVIRGAGDSRNRETPHEGDLNLNSSARESAPLAWPSEGRLRNAQAAMAPSAR